MAKSRKASLQMEEFLKTVSAGVEDVRRGVIIQLFTAVIKDTPVGNPDNWDSQWKDSEGKAWAPPEGYVGGRLRANWQTTVGSPAAGEVQSVDQNVALTSIKNNLGDGKQAVYLTNNLPYVVPIEYGGHSRNVAPKGMVRINVVKFRRMLKKQIDKVR